MPPQQARSSWRDWQGITRATSEGYGHDAGERAFSPLPLPKFAAGPQKGRGKEEGV